MTNKPFDPTKPVQTRGGDHAQILCADLNGTEYPIAARVQPPYGKEMVFLYNKDGRREWVGNKTLEAADDLVNIPVKTTVKRWVNVYQSGFASFFETKGDAVARMSSNCIALKYIEFEVEEGEGLE